MRGQGRVFGAEFMHSERRVLPVGVLCTGEPVNLLAMKIRLLLGMSVLLALGAIRTPAQEAAQTPDNIGHTRHKHHHNPPHETEAPTSARFVTSRRSEVVLPLPKEADAFTFVVFGDRTGGPVDGVKVLADAVRDVNLIEPDLVMTVGDLINGYNETPRWLEQMREFKAIMGELRSPWFPVVGNHDIYWRGQGEKPKGEHEQNYEMHFGPLWYAFEHKKCWFIALHSDEGNPVTGEKAIGKPESQRMSDEQFEWLKTVLARAKGADHVFLFLHHPRWLGGGYGDDWNKVHAELVSAGNVTAVFAGHIHRMRYDPKDGIEYVTLATVGGGQSATVPEAGWLHHYHLVTVRKKQVAMAAFPVGEAMDVRELTGKFADECATQSRSRPRIESPVALLKDGAADRELAATFRNTTSRPIDLTVTLDSADVRWFAVPDHGHTRIEPGAESIVRFTLLRSPGGADEWYRPIEMVVNTDVLMPGHRYSLPEQRVEVPVDASAVAPEFSAAGPEQVLGLDGDDALRIDPGEVILPDGPFTLECWMRADRLEGRTGLLCKTEGSDYGIFVSDGKPHFSVHLDGKYITAEGQAGQLSTGRWYHVAGVFDGAAVRIYVDGKLVSSKAGSGKRKTNDLPLMVGADVTGAGAATSHFTGRIDAVRVSKRALYAGDSFTPDRRPVADLDTLVLTNMDGRFGRGIWGASGAGPRVVGRAIGSPRLLAE
jgi:3',5'-cyclic AMP phosphodiesterase CpdA